MKLKKFLILILSDNLFIFTNKIVFDSDLLIKLSNTGKYPVVIYLHKSVSRNTILER